MATSTRSTIGCRALAVGLSAAPTPAGGDHTAWAGAQFVFPK